ncbi:hypothetical protein ACP70R_001840 [Stipagrostis hirtigluma subsp. patula]
MQAYAVAVDRLSRFVNRLLLLRDPVPLQECKFRFDSFPYVDGAEVDVWIRHALSWQVPVLIARLGTNVHTALADHPLVSMHLKRLELSEVKLTGSYLDLSSCTALEDLKLHACMICVGEIFSLSLKRMKITRCNFNFGAITHISVSSLRSLELVDCKGQTPLLESMPSLERAFVKLGYFDEDRCGKGTDACYCDEATNAEHSGEDTDEDSYGLCEKCCGQCANCCDNDNNPPCVLLGGLSSVTYFKLATNSLFTIKRDLKRCPMFSNLRTLVLDDWYLNDGVPAIFCFLLRTPLLQTLILKLRKEIEDYDVDKGFSKSMEWFIYLPHLRVIEVECTTSGNRVGLWELLKILDVGVKYPQQCTVTVRRV